MRLLEFFLKSPFTILPSGRNWATSIVPRDLAVSRDITVAPGSKNCSCLDLVMLSLPVSMTQGCFPIISDRNLTTAHCVVTVSDSAQDTEFFQIEPISPQCA